MAEITTVKPEANPSAIANLRRFRSNVRSIVTKSSSSSRIKRPCFLLEFGLRHVSWVWSTHSL